MPKAVLYDLHVETTDSGTIIYAEPADLGLYLGHQDRSLAWGDLEPAAKHLYEANHGAEIAKVEVVVEGSWNRKSPSVHKDGLPDGVHELVLTLA